MKAIRVVEWGQPVRLEDLPRPEPGDDEVLVQVHAASLNPLDSAVAAGYLVNMLTTPLTLGVDFSGEVVEVRKDVTNVKPGDVVYGATPFRHGTYCEYALPKSEEIALKPKSLDHIYAASIPLPSMAAYQSLFEHAGFQEGERILILGAAGNVGGLAAQFARNRAAYIYGLDIPEKADHAAKLGIDRFIAEGNERFEDVV